MTHQDMINRCTIWRSRRASHLEFKTADEAQAFTDGYDAFYNGAHQPAEEQNASGWLYAEKCFERRAEARRELAQDRAERDY